MVSNLVQTNTNKELNWREESKGTTKQVKDDKWKKEGKEVTHSYRNPITQYRNTHKKRRGRIAVYCRAIPDYVLYLYCTHGEVITTVAVSSKREEEGVEVLLLFVWVPSDDTLFIASDIQYWFNIITNGRYTVLIRVSSLPYQHDTIIEQSIASPTSTYILGIIV